MAATFQSKFPYAIIDNGGYEVKYGWATNSKDSSEMSQPASMPNCMAKIQKSMQYFYGDEISAIQNPSQLSLNRPIDRGYITNWNLEKEILQRVFDSNHMNIQSCKATNILFTLPPFCPEEIQIDTHEVLLEEFGFASVLCRPAPWFSAYEYSSTHPNIPEKFNFSNNSIVIDSGFSFTHILPFIDGSLAKHACKRINVGGKLLTNYLKETISYRQWNVMDEFLLINQVKESVCFVSTSFESELTKCYQLNGQMIVPIKYTHRSSPSSLSSSPPSPKHHHQQQRSNHSSSNINDHMEIQEEQNDSSAISGHVTNLQTDSHGEENGKAKDEDEDKEGNEEEEEEEEDVEYLRKFFVMPDFHRVMKGYVKEEGEAFQQDEQVLTMESERFTTPEVLFRPTDIGMNQAGIVETIGQSINSLHELEVGLCVKNIILTGGNSLFPNYRTRIQSEIFQYIPHQWAHDVKIFLPEDPINYAWYGAARFVKDEIANGTIQQHFLTKQEYHERGLGHLPHHNYYQHKN